MKGFPLKIDKRDIKRNMSSLAISIISEIIIFITKNDLQRKRKLLT